MLVDYQNKFDTSLTRMNIDLSDLRQDLSNLKQSYIELEAELSVARQVKNKLKDHTVSWERQCWSNIKEISGIPDKSDRENVENTALNIFRKLNVKIYSSNFENCHLLSSKGKRENKKMKTLQFVIARKT